MSQAHARHASRLPSVGARRGLTAIFSVSLLSLAVALCTPTAVAQVGDSVNYVNQSGDRHTHNCAQTNTTGGVFDNDLEAGPDERGDVDLAFADASGNVELTRSTGTQTYTSTYDRPYIDYSRPTPQSTWQQVEQVTSGARSGYQYLRYRNTSTGEFRYHLQAWRAVSGEMEFRTYYSYSTSDYQRDRINAFRSAVLSMNGAQTQMYQAGTAGVIVFALGLGATRFDSADVAGPVAACAAVVAGLPYLGNRWITWGQGRTSAIAAIDDLDAVSGS